MSEIYTPEQAEQEIRRRLWVGHGCTAALYGDDGEMQCNDAKRHSYLDFKRQELPDLFDRLRRMWKAEQVAAEAALTEARQALEASEKLLTDSHLVMTEQRARLAALTAENNRLLTVLREVSEYLDGSNYATDSGDLPDTVRAALASPEAPQSSG